MFLFLTGITAVYLLIDVLGLEAFFFGVIAHLSEPLEEQRVGAGGHRPLPTQAHCFRWHVEQSQRLQPPNRLNTKTPFKCTQTNTVPAVKRASSKQTRSYFIT